VVDVLAIDAYRGSYARKDYEQLLALAGDRPIGLGEVGRLPSPDTLRAQPRVDLVHELGRSFRLLDGGTGVSRNVRE